MFNPYFFTILPYGILAFLGALNASLISYDLLPWINGVRWMRVHLITLGILTQLIFALLPALVARRANLVPQKFRWDIWGLLNAGILALVYGISLINFPVIFTGGLLVFAAATLLGIQLYEQRAARVDTGKRPAGEGNPRAGRKFYIAGLSYFLLGILIGTGLWMGWGDALKMADPIEVHIHANNWGLMSLVFAGFLVDLYPSFTRRTLAWPRSVTPIFWMMTAGAFGLVLGPWFESLVFTMPGLVLHVIATGWLLLNVIVPLIGEKGSWTPGILHLGISYFWILAPILTAPFVLLGVDGISGVGVEQNAPQALIYGWVLQFGFALLPYFFGRIFLPDQPSRLGGTWFSLLAINLGCVFLWLNIFITPFAGLLHGTAYLLWALAMVPIARQVWGTLQQRNDVPILSP